MQPVKATQGLPVRVRGPYSDFILIIECVLAQHQII